MAKGIRTVLGSDTYIYNMYKPTRTRAGGECQKGFLLCREAEFKLLHMYLLMQRNVFGLWFEMPLEVFGNMESAIQIYNLESDSIVS